LTQNKSFQRHSSQPISWLGSQESKPNINKKLSYHRGTARRAMLVNSCSVSWCMGDTMVSNSKRDLQGH